LYSGFLVPLFSLFVTFYFLYQANFGFFAILWNDRNLYTILEMSNGSSKIFLGQFLYPCH
jgi:hypothetical protein